MQFLPFAFYVFIALSFPRKFSFLLLRCSFCYQSKLFVRSVMYLQYECDMSDVLLNCNNKQVFIHEDLLSDSE